MKSSYTFKATLADTDFVRICRENHQARFIVLRCPEAGVPAMTFVRAGSFEYYKLRQAQVPSGRVDVPCSDAGMGRAGKTWILFDCDGSKALEPKYVTTVEVY